MSLAVLGFIVNVTQVIHITLIKRRTSFQTFLISLSMTDLLTCLLSAVINGFYFGDTEHPLVMYLGEAYFVTIFLSSAHIGAIGVDRYIAVSHPVRHKIMYDRKRMRMILVAIWICVPVLVTSIVILERRYYSAANAFLIDYFFVLFTMTTAAVCVFVYVAISRILSNRRVNSWRKNRRIKSVRRVYFMCFLTTVSFIGCTLPACICRLGFMDNSIGYMLLTGNAGFNSFIYFFFTKLSKNCYGCGGELQAVDSKYETSTRNGRITDTTKNS